MENMEYYTQRLQCSDEEKDACLETVAKLYRLRWYLRENGALAAGVLAEEEADPFFRACLIEIGDVFLNPDELERRYTRYLMAGDYRGGAFLNAVLISEGLVLLARYEGETNTRDEMPHNQSWGELLGGTLRGYFGAGYVEKVTEVIRREEQAGENPKEYSSLLPEFDNLLELTPGQRDWLVRHVSSRTLCYAMKLGGSAVSKFLMEGAEDREALERDFAATTNVREMDVEAAQREILEKAEEAKKCM